MSQPAADLSYLTTLGWRDYLPYFPEPDSTQAAIKPAEHWWRWRDQHIHLDRYPVPSAPVKALLLHGGASYGRMLLPLARILAAAGCAVVAPDLPGYGLTVLGGDPLTHDGWLRCAADLAHSEYRADGRPVVPVGLSMSGLIAFQLAARLGPRVVPSAIALSLLDPADPATVRAMARWPVAAGPLTAFARHSAWLDRIRVPVRMLANFSLMTNEPRVNTLVSRDRLGGGGTISWRFARTYLDCAGLADLSCVTGQDLVLALPTADRLAPPQLSLAALERAPCRGRVIELDQGGHLPLEAPALRRLDELVREVAERIRS